jgi:hypothetical protein
MVLQQHVSLDILLNTWHACSGGSETKQGRCRGCWVPSRRGVGEEIAGGGAAPPKPERGREFRCFLVVTGKRREGRHGHGGMELLRRHGHGPRRGRPKELQRAGEKGSLLQLLTRRRSREDARPATGGAASGPGSLSSAMEMGVRAWTAEGKEEGEPAGGDGRARLHADVELAIWSSGRGGP